MTKIDGALLPARARAIGFLTTAPRGAPVKTRIYVTLKSGVLDPQGKAIHHALEGLGFAGVEGVRQGKLIELEHGAEVGEAELDAMCRKLLANTVIENYRIERE